MTCPSRVREAERDNVVYVLICVSCAGVGIPAGVVSGVSDLLENLNIKDNTADIETALESLKLQVSGECRGVSGHTCVPQ